MTKKKDFGWEYLDSSDSGSYNGDDGSWGYKNSDGSGSYNGADGSWGYKNSDGSGSWNGADGSWGYWNSDGTSTYYGKDNEIDQDTFDSTSKIVSGLAGILYGIGSEAINSSNRKRSHNTYIHNTKKNEKDDWKFWLLWFVFMFCIMIFCGIMYFIVVQDSKPKEDEIKIPLSAKEYKGENYKQIREEFEDMGFDNIECVGLNDLITGWIDKENSVEKISINGDTKFEEGDIFKDNAEIIISYHSFKRKQ